MCSIQACAIFWDIFSPGIVKSISTEPVDMGYTHIYSYIFIVYVFECPSSTQVEVNVPLEQGSEVRPVRVGQVMRGALILNPGL